MLYLILFLLCITIEFSPHVNTDNIIQKIGIGMIAIGALIEHIGKHNSLIVLGAILYFSVTLYSEYYFKYHRKEIKK